MCELAAIARTVFAVSREKREPVETISGARHAWRFRPHFHLGDEAVHVLAGRARLRLPESVREVVAGETLVIPAGVVHRFEPVDQQGWAFVSRFAPTSIASTRRWDGSRLAAQAVALLTQRPSLRTDIAAIARACVVSEGYLSRTFRHATGASLHNFHALIALHRAKALLRQQVVVVDAALAAGFNDQAHLNREFVRTFGMTPGVFRKGWATKE